MAPGDRSGSAGVHGRRLGVVHLPDLALDAEAALLVDKAGVGIDVLHAIDVDALADDLVHQHHAARCGAGG